MATEANICAPTILPTINFCLALVMQAIISHQVRYSVQTLVHCSPDAPSAIDYTLLMEILQPSNSMDCSFGFLVVIIFVGILIAIVVVCGIPLLVLTCAFFYQWYSDYKRSKNPGCYIGDL